MTIHDSRISRASASIATAPLREAAHELEAQVLARGGGDPFGRGATRRLDPLHRRVHAHRRALRRRQDEGADLALARSTRFVVGRPRTSSRRSPRFTG
jgi:hypothetical protein